MRAGRMIVLNETICVSRISGRLCPVCDSNDDDAGTTVYANAPYLDPDTAATTTAATASSTKGTNSAESAARPNDSSVPASQPPPGVVSKRLSGGRQAAPGKRSSMYHQTLAPGLDHPGYDPA